MRPELARSHTPRAWPGSDARRRQRHGHRRVAWAPIGVLCVLGATVFSDRAWAATYAVTTTADTTDAFDGQLSLREAILLANANVGPDTITFAIDNGAFGPPPHTLFVGAGIPAGQALPGIVDPVVIDGTSEPDYEDRPVIVLDGAAVSAQSAETNGLFVLDNGGGSSFFGLVIKRFPGTGVRLYAGDNIVEGNYIGTDPSGTLAEGNGGGVLVSVTDDNRIIDNLISGNQGLGIEIVGTYPEYENNGSRNQILENLIGTTADGTGSLGNAGDGVLISSTRNTVLGNVISGNGGSGISFPGTPWWVELNRVQRNRIGTDKDGTVPLPNAGHGVMITAGLARLQTIGGFGCRAKQPVDCNANTIAFNKGDGVFLQGPGNNLGNSIRANAIFGNGGLGIDLAPNGVTPNDPFDPDEGPNGLLNFPVLGGAYAASFDSVVLVTLDYPPSALVHVDFYVNDAVDRSLHGEGQRYLTSRSFNAPLTPQSVSVVIPWIAPGKYLTATATDAGGSTSEFSNAVVVR